jgi:hypothetical protein
LSGTAGLEQTLDKTVGALHRAEVPHLLASSFADRPINRPEPQAQVA